MLHLAELSFHKLNTLLNFDKQIKSNQRCSGKQVPDEGYWKKCSPSPGIRHGGVPYFYEYFCSWVETLILPCSAS